MLPFRPSIRMISAGGSRVARNVVKHSSTKRKITNPIPRGIPASARRVLDVKAWDNWTLALKSSMQPVSPDFAQMKSNMKASWMAGDFGRIANYSARASEDFVARTEIKPGSRVLDVACGTGNSAIPAARAGGRVTGVDIAPNLLEQARVRAATERLEILFQEGDAEQLPCPDNSFDFVITMF